MNQYARKNAIHRIDGYLVPRPLEDARSAFERAKTECLENMRQSLADVEAVTFEMFTQSNKTR